MPDPRDFSSVTEGAATRATREQLLMIRTRYALAADAAAGRRVLEVACGTGRGLGWLRSVSTLAVGGDITESLITEAHAHYQGRVPLLRFDAQRMPFKDASFDVIVMFEAIYYLPDPKRFLDDCRRVLSPGGQLLICSANREWDGFTASPFAHKFHSADELGALISASGFSVTMRAAFPAAADTVVSAMIRTVRRVAVRLGVIPKTLAGREWLKRLFYGELAPLGPEVPVEGDRAPLAAIPPGPVRSFKVLYALADRIEIAR